MKKVLKTIILLVAVSIAFSSCKKDPVDLENSYMDFLIEDDLWAADNEVRVIANLTQGSLVEDMASINISSEADPEGITIERGYYRYAAKLGHGGQEYNVDQLDFNFYTAVYSDAENKTIKVNPDGDKVTITIDDNVFSDEISFVKPYDPLFVADFHNSGGDWDNWSIYYYNEEGAIPDIKMYSKSHPDPVTISPNSDLGENGYRAADPEVSGHDFFGNTAYGVQLVYEPRGGSNEVVIEGDDDVIYLEMGDDTFSVPYSNDPLEMFYVPMRKE